MPRPVRKVFVSAIIIFVVTLVVFAAVSWPTARVFGALMLVFLLPGWVVVMALMPRTTLGIPQRILLSIVTSVTLVILGGLVLNLTPWGLQPGSWVVLLTGITLIAGVVAWLRMRNSEMAWHFPHVGLGIRQVMLFVLALGITGIALRVALTPPSLHGEQGYTILWMLTPDPKTPNTLQLGVDNREFSEMTYNVIVLAAGRTIQEWPSIRLMPDSQWETVVELTPGSVKSGDRLEADLYKADAPGIVYRHVSLLFIPK